jgi:molybdopterin molybdotransferase
VRGRRAFFGLPGNPVSVLVAMEMFVLPALRRMAGWANVRPVSRRGRLSEAVAKKPGRRTFAPARLLADTEIPEIAPLRSHGSAHLAAHAGADVIFTLPADSAGADAGQQVEYYPRES